MGVHGQRPLPTWARRTNTANGPSTGWTLGTPPCLWLRAMVPRRYKWPREVLEVAEGEWVQNDGAMRQDKDAANAIDEVDCNGIAEGACEEVFDTSADAQTTAASAEAGDSVAHEHEMATEQPENLVLSIRVAAGVTRGESGWCEESFYDLRGARCNGSVNEESPHQRTDMANAFNMGNGEGDGVAEGAGKEYCDCKECGDAIFGEQTIEVFAHAGNGAARELESVAGEHADDAENGDRSSAEVIGYEGQTYFAVATAPALRAKRRHKRKVARAARQKEHLCAHADGGQRKTEQTQLEDEGTGVGEQAAHLGRVYDVPAHLAEPYAHVLEQHYELYGEHLPHADARLLLDDLVASCG